MTTKYQIFCNGIEVWSTVERAAVALRNPWISTRLGDLMNDDGIIRKMSEEDRRFVFYHIEVVSAIRNDIPVPEYVPLEPVWYDRIITNELRTTLEKFFRCVLYKHVGKGKYSIIFAYVMCMFFMGFGFFFIFFGVILCYAACQRNF